MKAIRDTATYPQGQSHHVTREAEERRECVVGNRDDPALVRFLKAWAAWRAKKADEDPDTECSTFDELVDEAERRYWESRGDPASEAERLLQEARRLKTTQADTTDDQ